MSTNLLHPSIPNTDQDRRYFKQQEITLWRKGPTKEKDGQKTFDGSDATKKL
jgi:hypothetical protein